MPGWLLQDDADEIRKRQLDEWRQQADQHWQDIQRRTAELLNPGTGPGTQQPPAPAAPPAQPQPAPSASPAPPAVDQSALIAYLNSPLGSQYGQPAQMPEPPVATGGQPVPMPQPNVVTGGGQPAQMPQPGGQPTPTLGQQSQFGDPQLTSAEAYAACGPAAAIRFAQRYGRNPTLSEAMAIAKTVGWTPDGGMNGVANQKRLMDEIGVPTKVMPVDWQAYAREASTGNPVMISTPGHYYTADSYNPQTGQFHVGRSGLDLRGGKEWMTQEEMEARMGPSNGALFADNPQVQAPSTATAGAQVTPADQIAAGQSTAALSSSDPRAGRVGEQGAAILQGAANAASWLGDQGQKALQAVLVTEGGLTGARGDSGSSAGPLQFFGEEGGRAGQLNAFANQFGMTLAQARDYVTQHPIEAIAWAIGTVGRPGYLGQVIGAGIGQGLTGSDLATYVQKNGQVSVSPERAGEVWKSLFGGGQELIGGLGTAMQNANQPPFTLPQGQDFSGLLKSGQDLVSQTAANAGSTLSGLQGQANQGISAWDQMRQDQADRIKRTGSDIEDLLKQGQQNIQSQFSQTFQPPSQPPGGDMLNTGFGQQPPEQRNLFTGFQRGLGEIERQKGTGPIETGLELGMGLMGQEPSPEFRQFARQAQVGMPGAVQPDAGGVVSAFLKGSGLREEITLPNGWKVPLADVIGAGANLLVPMGAEKQFGEGAFRSALTEASRLGRRDMQFGWARGLEEGAGWLRREAGPAARMATSVLGRWARASVEDIARDLAKGPVGDFMRSEAGELDIGVLMQVAADLKKRAVRMYTGTAADFERADLSRADPSSLYGPGLYSTDDPRIAGGIVDEAQRGWAARFGNPNIGYTFGPIKATQREAAEWLRQSNADMLAKYSGLTKRDLPKALIVPRELPVRVAEEGYAQAAAGRAGLPTPEQMEGMERQIASLQDQIPELERRLASGEDPESPVSATIANPLGRWLEGRRMELSEALARRERALNAYPSGPNVRALDVPRDLNLFDIDHEFTAAELDHLQKVALSEGMGTVAQRVFSLHPPIMGVPVAPPKGQNLYAELQSELGLNKAEINQFLERAGYDGITHQGGNIRPMVDARTGENIRHQVRILFQSGLDKSRNAISGRLASFTPDASSAALGGAGGAAAPGAEGEDLSWQERLYRGLGGAFVAGALRNKHPAVAAFEATALRKGATAMEISDAVKAAREVGGKVSKFEGPIADAANAAFKAAPGKDAVLAARNFLRDFGGNLKQAAPPNAQTDSGMARLHNHLLELARQGESQRHWYTDASQAIKDFAQGDKVKAEKLAQLFAIYSPGTSVAANTQNAIAAWSQYLEGLPIDVGKGDLDKKASQLLYDNVPWEGRKTNNFYRNLMKQIDPEVWRSMGKEDGQTGTTVDIWMMRALKYLQDAPSMGEKGQYEFAQRAIERVAKELGWQPDEAQAAIWSAQKAASEGGTLTEAGYHYGTGLAERAAQIGQAGVPDLFKDADGQDVLVKASGLFGHEGQVAIPAAKGSQTLYDAAGEAIRDKTGTPISVPIPEAKGAIHAAARQTIDAVAAARAWVEQLPEISWSRVFVDKKPTLRDSNSLAVFLGRSMTDDEATQLASRIGGQVDVTPTQDGALIINKAGRHERTTGDPLAGQWIPSEGAQTNQQFHKAANEALGSLPSVEEASTAPFRADTTTLRNDWSANPNGEDYAAVIGRSARAQALWDVARPLAARVREVGGRAAAGATSESAARVPGTQNLASVGLGATAGLTGDEDLTPEERAQRGVGGALAAGIIRPRTTAAVRRLMPNVQGVLGAVTPLQSTAQSVARAAGPKTFGQHIAEFISSNLLSGPGLIWNVLNQTGHLAWQPLQRLTEGHPVEAFNALQSIAASAPDALERAAAVYRRGTPYAGVGGTQQRPLDKISLGMRTNLAGDALMRTLNENMAGLLESQRLIREAGATTPAQAAAVIQRNAAQIQKYAEQHGNISALTGAGGRSPWIRDLSNTKAALLSDPNLGKQLGGLAMHIMMPFARVPEEILYQTFRNAPVLGQVMDGLDYAKAAPGAEKVSARSKAMLNAVISAAVIGAALNDQIRGPDDPEHPSQAHIGNSWVPLTSLGTLGGRMLLTLAVTDAWRDPTNPDNAARVNEAVNNVGKMAAQEYPLFDTIRTVSRLGQGGATSVLTGLGSQVLGGLTPMSGALGAVENITDPYARQAATSGPGDIYEPNLARIPGLAQNLPPRVNQVTGEPMLRPSSGLGSLLRVQNEPKTQGPLAQEIARLERLGYQIPNPKDNPEQISYQGSVVPLSREEGTRMAEARGRLISQQLEQYMSSSYWAQLTDDQKAQIIARVIARASSRNAPTFLAGLPAEERQTRLLAGRQVQGRPVAAGV